MLFVALILGLPAQTAPANLKDLARLNDCQLQALFAQGWVPEEQHCAKTRGRVFTKPGKMGSRLLGASLWPLWHGKQLNFCADGTGVMLNRLPGGLEVVPAAIETRPSLVDGNPALVFDYQGMQKKGTQFAEVAFDEVRQVNEGLWLGRMWLRQKDGTAQPTVWFGLQEVR
jgi:hypothetical protein